MSDVYGVLNASRGSAYEDRIEERYHLPDRILAPARRMVGARIVYYEPRRTVFGRGRMAYFACARVDRIEIDKNKADHHFLVVEDFVPFRTPVPLQRGKGLYWESRQTPLNSRGYTQNSIRDLSGQDFAAIVNAGLGDLFDDDKIPLHDMDEIARDPQTSDLFRIPAWERERRVEQILLSRPVRNALFRSAVRSAYDYRCAVTGLCIRNGGGRPEVEAAHIHAVEDGGPDVVQNGLALSQTVHWMFDRGLIGLRDDYSLIVSDNKVPEIYRGLIRDRDNQIALPEDPTLRPDPYFLAKHRAKHCL